MLLLALLFQEASTGNPTAVGILRFFAGFFLILIVYGGTWFFTYWINRDE